MADLDAFIFGVDLDGVCADYTLGLQGSVSAHRSAAHRLSDRARLGLHPVGFRAGRLRIPPSACRRDRAHVPYPRSDPRRSRGTLESERCGGLDPVITHRLYVNWGHQAAVADTVAWLDDARIPYRDLCFLGAKPQVEADLYIDDSPGNITGLRKAGNDVIVFDQPYNRDMAGPRAGNWSEVEEIVMERYTAWSGVHGVQPVLPGVTNGDRLHGQRPT